MHLDKKIFAGLIIVFCCYADKKMFGQFSKIISLTQQNSLVIVKFG